MTVESLLLRDTLAPFRADLDALSREDLLTIRLDVFGAVKQGLGVVAKIERYRDALIEVFGPRIGERIDRLRAYGPALEVAHATYLRLTAPAATVARLSEQVVDLRESLELAARSLEKEGHLPKGSLGNLQGAVGYRNQVSDALQLVDLFRTHEAELVGKTAITSAQVARAESLAHELQRMVGERDQASTTVTVTEERQRMYTLFVEAYEDVRRAIVYLRWREGDADELAPSLYASRGQRKGDSEDATPTGESPTTPSVTTTTPSVTTTPTSDARATSAPTPTSGTPSVATPPIPIGYPGSDPFIRST